jgi:hypothetical protein
VILAAIALVLASGASANAHGGHGTCRDFGIEGAARGAHELRPFGQTLSPIAQQGLIDEAVAGFHVAFCD